MLIHTAVVKLIEIFDCSWLVCWLHYVSVDLCFPLRPNLILRQSKIAACLQLTLDNNSSLTHCLSQESVSFVSQLFPLLFPLAKAICRSPVQGKTWFKTSKIRIIRSSVMLWSATIDSIWPRFRAGERLGFYVLAFCRRKSCQLFYVMRAI